MSTSQLAQLNTNIPPLAGVLLPDRIPVNWQNFSAMRSLVIDCGPVTATAPPPAATRRGPAGTAAGAVNGSTGPQIFGSSEQLDSLLQFIMNKEGVSVHSISIINCGMQVGKMGPAPMRATGVVVTKPAGGPGGPCNRLSRPLGTKRQRSLWGPDVVGSRGFSHRVIRYRCPPRLSSWAHPCPSAWPPGL